MHGEQAENLFRDYLKQQGWRYWTETDFRRKLGLNKADPAPDFTILDASGAPKALVEVSQIEWDSDSHEEGELIPIKTSPLAFKVRKKARQLGKVQQNLKKQYGNLPTLLVLYDPQGAQTHHTVIMQKILGLAFPNAHLSAIAALYKEEMSAKLSGFEQEIKKIKATDYKEFLYKFEKIYNKYLQKEVDVDEEIPVLKIYQNPNAEVEWERDLWGRFDQVWGLIDKQTYGLIYNGLMLGHAGILEGVALPDPAYSSRSSGFYDE